MTSYATYVGLMNAFETATCKKQRKAILAKVRELAAADSSTYVK